MSAVSGASHGSGGSGRKNRWGFGSSAKAPSAAPSGIPDTPVDSGASKKAPPPGAGAGSVPGSVAGSKAPSRSGSKGARSVEPSERGGAAPSERGSKAPSERGSKAPSERGSKAPSERGGAAPSERSGSRHGAGASAVGSRARSEAAGSQASGRGSSKKSAAWNARVPSVRESEVPDPQGMETEDDNVHPEDSVSCAPPPRLLSSVDARLRDVEDRLRQSVDERSGVTPPRTSEPRSVTMSAGGASKPPRPPSSSSRSSLRKGASAAPSAAGIGSSVELVKRPESTLSMQSSSEIPLPLSGLGTDMDVLTDGLQKAIAVVRAAEYSLNGQIVEYAQRMESRVDVAYRSEERLSEELGERTKELLEAQVTLEACQSEIERQRASSAAESEYRNALMCELAKANEAVVSIKDEQQVLEDELQQTREELSARDIELQQARDELRACTEGQSAAQLREEELEERLAGLQEAERTLQAELVDTQAALQAQLGTARAELEDAHAELAAAREELSKNERDLREELAQVQAELEAAKAELKRRQKCCLFRPKKPAAKKDGKEDRAVLDC